MRPLAALALLASAPALAEPDDRLALRDAMVAELERSVARLKLDGFEAPYFIAYTVRDYDSVDVHAKNGALLGNLRNRARQAYVEVRVGDYRFDNTADARAAGDFNAAAEELY